MTPGLINYVRARLVEDGTFAKAANTDEERRPWGDPHIPPVPESEWGNLFRGYLGGDIGEHAARWDPQTVLADITIKRTLLDHAEATAAAAATLAKIAPGTAEEREMHGRAASAMRSVRNLARAYTARDDYPGQWRLQCHWCRVVAPHEEKQTGVWEGSGSVLIECCACGKASEVPL